MQYLLDTQILLWYLEDRDKLPNKITSIIDDESNDIAISLISLWEIAIKVKLGKLTLDIEIPYLIDHLEASDFTLLGLESDYIKTLFSLPTIHKDPFDRLLISTAKSENMVFISSDANIHKYHIPTLWSL